MAEMKARITLDSSGYKSGAFSMIEDTNNMINATKKARESIEQFSNTKIKADTSEAEKNISKMQESINNLKKNVSFMVQAKDQASESINRIKSNVSSLVKTNYKLEISAVDKTKSIITGIRDSIFNLKTLALGIVLGGTAKKGFDLTIGNAMTNELSLATLQTVLKSKQSGSDALKWSYKEAANTPFDAKEVVAGVSQLATSGLDYKKYLEPLGDAAAAFNKPLEQAIFAMGKLKSGQLGMGVDMLRDFGVSNQDWTKNGVKFSKNGEMQGMTGDQASEMALKILKNKYGGLMDEHSGTAKGLISNIGDTINNMGRGLAGIDDNGQVMKGGLFDNFKNQIKEVGPILDKIQSSNAFKDLQKQIGELATAGGQKLTAFLKGFENPNTIKEYKANFKMFIDDVKAGITITKEFGSALLAVGKVLEPLIQTVAAHPKLFVGLFAGYEGIKGGITILGILKNLNSEIKYLPTAVGVFRLNVIGAFTSVLGVIKAFSISAIAALKPFFAFIVANPVVAAIAGISLAVIGLHEAWIHNWGGIQEKTHAVIKAVEDDWAAWKKEWTKLKEFFKDPITTTIKSVNQGTGVNTKRTPGAGPQGLAVDSGNTPQNNKPIFSNVSHELNETWLEISKWFSSLPSKIVTKLQGIGPAIQKWSETQNKENIRQFTEWGNEISKWFSSMPGKISSQMSNWGKSITKWFTDMRTNIPKDMANWWKGMETWFNNTKIAIPKKMNEWKTGITKWFSDMRTNIPKSMASWWTGMGKWFTDTKKNISDSLSGWWTGIKKWFSDAGTNAPREMKTSFVKSVAVQKTDTSNALGKMIVDSIEFMLQLGVVAIVATARELIKRFIDTIRTFPKDIQALGKEFIDWFKKGIEDSDIVSAAKKLVQKVKDVFTGKSGFDINSPSKVMYEIGGHVIQGFINGMSAKNLKNFVGNLVGTVKGAFGGTNVPGGVNEWLMQALVATGTPLTWLPGLQRLVMAESGGDPNNWNSQSVGGEHATGLLQTLPSTFKEFMQRGMGNILNPVDNAAAAINYIKSRYGDVYNTPLFKGGSYAGYANGGITNQPSIFGEAGLEAAIPLKKNNSRSQQLLDIADNYINGDKKSSGKDDKDVNLIINFNGVTVGEEEFFDKAGEHIVKKVRLAIQNM